MTEIKPTGLREVTKKSLGLRPIHTTGVHSRIHTNIGREKLTFLIVPTAVSLQVQAYAVTKHLYSSQVQLTLPSTPVVCMHPNIPSTRYNRLHNWLYSAAGYTTDCTNGCVVYTQLDMCCSNSS